MNILIQKFGGTSVSTSEKRKMACEKVQDALKKGYAPIVVVSAMGRKGEPYATDTLLGLVDEKFKENNHLSIDLLISCGEVISTVIMCMELSKYNINCMPLTGGQAGIITNDNYNDAECINVDTNKLESLISKGVVPVIAGFQGQTKNNHVTTLGRGGSDVSAALIGCAMKAQGIEIYTDVNGIMTADPRIVPNASLIEEISYYETFQFAEQGAKVIHPRAVEIAMKSDIPLLIKNTMNNCDGTVIKSIAEENKNSIITGITHLSQRTQINVSKEDNLNNTSYFKLLDILADNEINIDLINIFPQNSIFTIDSKDIYKLKSILNSTGINFSYIEGCSKISIIGDRMRGIPGIMAKIINSLSKENIEVLQTADSHSTIWCLVKDENTSKAIRILHQDFNLS